MSAIAASFTDKSEPKAVISNGIKIKGEKYMTIEASDDSVKAKKVRSPARPQHMIAHHNAEIQTPNAFNSVAELGEYLKKVGY
jgi:profilin